MIERLRVQIPAGAAREISSPESTLYTDSYSVSVPPPRYRSCTLKTPCHFAKSTGGKLHLFTHTPLTLRSRRGLSLLSRHGVGTYQGKELTRNSSGNTRPQSSQLAVPPWTDPGIKTEISVRNLHSQKKKKKKERKKRAGGNE